MSHVGVIVGRFQTPWLHEGHLQMIRYAALQATRLILFIGVSPVPGSKSDPLDFGTRSSMLSEFLNTLTSVPSIILPIADKAYDQDWADSLDARIREVEPFAKIKMYGGRDSFLPTYTNFSRVKHPVQVVPTAEGLSSTAIRKSVATTLGRSQDFREGAVYTAQRRYSSGLATVDVAIHDHSSNELLLGRKPGEEDYRFIGGFYDPAKDASLENAAQREAGEETGIEIGKPQYLGSRQISDWRYQDAGGDKIITSFFLAPYIHRAQKAGDDIASLVWIKVEELASTPLVSAHAPLRDMLLKFFANQKTEVNA